MPNFKFHRVEPNENYPLIRLQSEDGSYEVGCWPVLFGARVRAGRASCESVDIDYCAGDDAVFLSQLLVTVVRILETIPVGTPSSEICRMMPGYVTRPINRDPCWDNLLALAAKRRLDAGTT